MDFRVGRYIEKFEKHPRDILVWEDPKFNFFKIGDVSDWWDLNKTDLSWAQKWWALVPRTFIFQQRLVDGSVEYTMDNKTFDQLVELKAIMEHWEEIGWPKHEFRHLCEKLHTVYLCESEVEPYFDEVVNLIR